MQAGLMANSAVIFDDIFCKIVLIMACGSV